MSFPIEILNDGAQDHKIADLVHERIGARDIVVNGPTGLSVKHPLKLSGKYANSNPHKEAWGIDVCSDVSDRVISYATSSAPPPRRNI